MKTGTVGRLFLVLLVLNTLSLSINVRIGKANPTIVINADGSVTPSTAPIQRDGDLYTFTSDIYDSIQVMKGNIIVDGDNFKLQGTGTGTGFYVPHSYQNVTARNTVIAGFTEGIFMYDTVDGAIINCSVTGNSMGIRLIGSWRIEISGNLLTENVDAINYWDTHYGDWVGNRIINNSNGITGRGLDHVNIISNRISNDAGTGIRFEAGHYNSISQNSIEYSHLGIDFVEMALNNIITGNVIAHNAVGVILDPVIPFLPPYIIDNSFCHNNFVNNTQQAYVRLGPDIPPQPNSWDNGYPSGGNFWSDCNGADMYSGPVQNVIGSDGIGDTSYVIAQGNVDRYPLMTPYSTIEFFVLRITTTTGGTTNPEPGPYVYTSGTVVEVTAVPEADWMLDHWELDNINVGATSPISVTVEADHALKAVFKPRPDIAVTSVVPYPTSVHRGQPVYIDVTVANQRFTSETFDIIVYADAGRKTIGDEIIVGVQTVYNLLPGGTKTITFVWDTSTLPSGTTYYISAKAIIPYDMNPTNNLLTAKKKVTIRR
jgi:parallel beta-helix repeat protein